MPSAPVPLDLELDQEKPLLLVTGPNMGGKTVALKTAGLTALLAMAGLPVPAAEGTRIPWFDHVVCDIGDEQSLMEDVSTFLSHLRRVSEAISIATTDSLVLLDELGSGTDPTEGAALGQAIVERLLERRTLCVATTHHGALKSFASEAAGARNASMAFDEETLRPRFTLLIGVPGRSRAIQVAERFGMDESVLARARALLPKGERDLGALIEELGSLKNEVARERELLAETRMRLAERREIWLTISIMRFTAFSSSQMTSSISSVRKSRTVRSMRSGSAKTQVGAGLAFIASSIAFHCSSR
jgi:DNA mismatch repair protein MutS2